MKINVGFTNKLQYRKMTGGFCKTLNFEATVLHPIYVAMSGFTKDLCCHEIYSDIFFICFQVLSLTGELQSFKMECQDVDTKFKDIVSFA